ncbi:MAG: cysteine--tRNA ligase [Deltaproteobacteria bacterium]|nr:cysteine--tRNA ligase [Deltaproteobacteria bacterium]
MRYDSILDMIGNTPLVEIRKLNPNEHVKIYAKLESCNPGGSIKDRAALNMIEQAEKKGLLTPGKIILEATSGNTGIGLALVAAAKGYQVTLVMSEGASEERKKITAALGAELIFTPAHLGTDGAIEVVYEMLRENPEKYFVPDQYNNEDNLMAHYYGTAPEIWEQTRGAVTMVVATLGTSGTAMGLSQRLKEFKSDIRIIGVEPYLRHKIQGLKNMKESYRPGIFDRGRLDEKVNILDEHAFETARELARVEGLLVGMSSGAALYVALQKARELQDGVIVVIFPDSGERYLSTELFAGKEETTVRLYNTLVRKKEFFKPRDSENVLIHSCGPTVHEIPHVGTYRRFVVTDLLVRYLTYRGYRVRQVTNVIDMADRSISGAERSGMELKDFTGRNMAVFFSDVGKLSISNDTLYPRASEHVNDMVALAEKLVEKGYAYEKLRSLYFDISRLEDYGMLSNIDLKQVRHASTTDQDDYEKESPVDFTLLKRSTLAELKKGIYFKTRWGNVRPSWHLECAAISMKYLNESFDVFLSGTDIIFPHCENVLAIGKAATGKNIARYWLNSELVMVDGKKMSRSLKNAYTIEDLEKMGYTGRELRYFLLSSHYRKPLNFSFGALDTARNTIRRLDHFIQRLSHYSPGSGHADVDQHIYDVRQGFREAMDDDLNVSGALAAISEFVRVVNIPLTERRLGGEQADEILRTLGRMDAVLGIMDFGVRKIGSDIVKLIEEREDARKDRRWDEADRIRRELARKGVMVHDTPDGPFWTLQ